MNTDHQAEKKREYDKKWREKHHGYDAERSRKYREKFAANHICTCLICGKEFHGYKASYCSDECRAEGRRKAHQAMHHSIKPLAVDVHFRKLVDYVKRNNLVEILRKIPRCNESDFEVLKSYIRRNNLQEYLRSIPRIVE